MRTLPCVPVPGSASSGGAGAVPAGEWALHELAEATSTNLVAASFPAWTAVRADRQSAGRGRFQRTWVSDEGGLWLSAVVPLPPEPAVRSAVPLAVGLAVCDALRELGVPALRMRWPNDVLVGDRKLAGLLIDQFEPGLAVAGIGINGTNRPEALDPALRGRTARLADLLPSAPPLRDLAILVLRHLRPEIEGLLAGGRADLLDRVNRLWGPARPVELDLDGRICRGLFVGVDDQGRLALADAVGATAFYEAHQVRHLTETNH